MPKISITVRPSVAKVISTLSRNEERSFSQMAATLIDDGIKSRVIPFIKENKEEFRKAFVGIKPKRSSKKK
jgi:hypothetical protein